MTWTTQPRSEGPGGLAFWTTGSGPPLVLIHGVGLRAEAWDAMIPYLVDQYAIHAVDMPGHGESVLADTGSLSDFVARFHRYIASLDAPVCIAGHSMGAMIALELAVQNPAKIRGIAAINAVFRRTDEAASAVTARANALDGTALPAPDATLQRWFGAAPEGITRRAKDVCEKWLTDVDPKGYQRAYGVFAGHDGPADTDLENLLCPALFMTGGRDPNSTPQMSHDMAALVPNGCAKVIEDAAHMLPMTHPDVASQHVLSALTSHGGSR